MTFAGLYRNAAARPLARPSAATISNFAGNGTLPGSDQIDLRDVKYSSVQDSFANGVLTVTDGSDTAKLTFNGSYTLANFKFASDGNGGTIVYDPPVLSSSQSSSRYSGWGVFGGKFYRRQHRAVHEPHRIDLCHLQSRGRDGDHRNSAE